jgi:N-acetylmuramoyl-L-alanine amidase
MNARIGRLTSGVDMRVHRVQQGECLSTIAAHYRIGKWQELYNHGSNADLRKLRPNPNILFPGDEVFIPDLNNDKRVECSTGKSHRFTLNIPQTVLRIFLKDVDGEPFAHKKYIVHVGDKDIEGVTGPDGLVETEVPVGERTALLSVWLWDDDPDDPDIEYELQLGHLDPARTIEGVQARLQNLGFRCTLDGVLGPQTAGAIGRFREKYKVPQEGEDLIDDALCDKLAELHEGA